MAGSPAPTTQLAYVPYQRRHRLTPSSTSLASSSFPSQSPPPTNVSRATPIPRPRPASTDLSRLMGRSPATGSESSQPASYSASPNPNPNSPGQATPTANGSTPTPPPMRKLSQWVAQDLSRPTSSAPSSGLSSVLSGSPSPSSASLTLTNPNGPVQDSPLASSTSPSPPPLPSNKPQAPPARQSLPHHRSLNGSPDPAPARVTSPRKSAAPSLPNTPYPVRVSGSHVPLESSSQSRGTHPTPNRGISTPQAPQSSTDHPLGRPRGSPRTALSASHAHARSASATYATAPSHHWRAASGQPYPPHSSTPPQAPLLAPAAPGGLGLTHNISHTFVAARRTAANAPERREAELSEQRSLRRLEKLVRLHLDARTQFDVGYEAPKLTTILKHRERTRAREQFVREGEQSLVSWVSDTSPEAKACAICSTAFGFARGIRRHHCRLCGRCVCATFAGSAPDDTSSLERCSGIVGINPQTLFVALEFDAVRLPFAAPNRSTAAAQADISIDSATTSAASAASSTERVTTRMCRGCKGIINRAQYMLQDDQDLDLPVDQLASDSVPHPPSLPDYVGWHTDLEKLEASISSALPEFQEMVLGLEKAHAQLDHGSDSPLPKDLASQKAHAKRRAQLQAQSRDAAAARRRLLSLFGEYERLARLVRPPHGNPTDAHKRVRESIWTRANLFLQQNLFPLQALPKFGTKNGSGHGTPTESDTKVKEAEEEVGKQNQMLSVLAEQATQVQQYLDEAKAARRWDDASALAQSLAELQREMRHLMVALPRTAPSGRPVS